jgi:hypothetical protein
VCTDALVPLKARHTIFIEARIPLRHQLLKIPCKLLLFLCPCTNASIEIENAIGGRSTRATAPSTPGQLSPPAPHSLLIRSLSIGVGNRNGSDRTTLNINIDRLCTRSRFTRSSKSVTSAEHLRISNRLISCAIASNARRDSGNNTARRTTNSSVNARTTLSRHRIIRSNAGRGIKIAFTNFTCVSHTIHLRSLAFFDPTQTGIPLRPSNAMHMQIAARATLSTEYTPKLLSLGLRQQSRHQDPNRKLRTQHDHVRGNVRRVPHKHTALSEAAVTRIGQSFESKLSAHVQAMDVIRVVEFRIQRIPNRRDTPAA